MDPLSVSGIAGIPERRGSSYFKWLLSVGVRLTADYSHSAIGLSILIARFRRHVEAPPMREWIFKHILTSSGSVTIYRYPRELGDSVIAEAVRRVADAEVYRFEEIFFPRPSYEYYWIGEFPSPRTALRLLADHPRFFTLDYPISPKPPSQAALFILSVLERNALIKDTDIARLRWRTRHPRRKLAKHLQALRASGALRGTMINIPYPTSSRVLLIIRTDTYSKSRRVAEAFAKYLYATEVGIGYDTVFVNLAMSERYAPLIRRYVEKVLAAECVDSIAYDTSNIVEEYVLPYWNYDPFKRGWRLNHLRQPTLS